MIFISVAFTKAYSFIQIIFVLLIFLMVRNGSSIFGTLKSKGMKILGDISYSIYLTHGLILYFAFSTIKIYNFKNGMTGYYLMYPLFSIVVVSVSLTTYRFIEHRFFISKIKLKTGVVKGG